MVADDVIAKTWAPNTRAICRAKRATPPVPCASTVCPGCSGVATLSADHTDTAAQGRGRGLDVGEIIPDAQQGVLVEKDMIGEHAVSGHPDTVRVIILNEWAADPM